MTTNENETQKPKKDYLINDDSGNMNPEPQTEDPNYKAAQGAGEELVMELQQVAECHILKIN